MIGRKLRAKKVNEGIEMPRYAHEGDAGLDLRITETVTLEPMQKCVVGCGLAVEIPSGCVGLVFPRSGLAKLGMWEAFKLWRSERKRARSGGDGM